MGAGEGTVVDFFDAIFFDFAWPEVETSSEESEQASFCPREVLEREFSEDKAVNDIEMKRKTVQRELTRLNPNLNKELEGSQG